MREYRNLKKDLFILLLIIVLGVGLRLDFLLNSTLDADEAIVGLMAKHLLEGGETPIFYYGQHYMGSFEALIAALLFNWFGASATVLKMVPLIFSVLLIPLTYLLGAIIGGSLGGRLAALLMAVAPGSMILWSSKARGGFSELIFLGTLAACFATKWLVSEKPRAALTFVIWFILGLGWWVNNQIIFFMLPIGLLGFVQLVRQGVSKEGGAKVIIQHVFIAAIAFLSGGTPFWIYNLENNFISFEMFRGAKSGDVWTHFVGLITQALPMIFGATRFWTDNSLFPGSILIGYLLYGIPLVWSITSFAIINSRRQLEQVWALRLMSLIFFSTVLIFTVSSFGHLVQAPRYLLPLYVPLMVITGAFLAGMSKLMPGLAYSWVGLLLAFNLASSYLGGRAVGGEPFVYSGERVAKDHAQLITWLKRKKINYVRTNYWIGYRLAFETGEKIKFSVFKDPLQVRIPAYEDNSDRDQAPMVLVPAQAARIKKALQMLRIPFKDEVVGEYVVIYDIEREKPFGYQIPVQNLGPIASDGQLPARFAVDGDIKTRWGSGRAQRKGMTFRIDFDSPTKIQSVLYELAEWKHDYPRGLEAYLILDDGKREQVLTAEAYDALASFCGDSIRFQIDPKLARGLEFKLVGEDPVFDWSIAEISLFSDEQVRPRSNQFESAIKIPKSSISIKMVGNVKK